MKIAAMMVTFFLLSLVTCSSVYEPQYFSSLEETQCPSHECPGKLCLCVMGADDIWYFNHTVGDVE